MTIPEPPRYPFLRSAGRILGYMLVGGLLALFYRHFLGLSEPLGAAALTLATMALADREPRKDYRAW